MHLYLTPTVSPTGCYAAEACSSKLPAAAYDSQHDIQSRAFSRVYH